MPSTTLKGAANLLVMPNVGSRQHQLQPAARVSASDGVTIGPDPDGHGKPVHIVTAISFAPHRQYGGAGGGGCTEPGGTKAE